MADVRPSFPMTAMLTLDRYRFMTLSLADPRLVVGTERKIHNLLADWQECVAMLNLG